MDKEETKKEKALFELFVRRRSSPPFVELRSSSFLYEKGEGAAPQLRNIRDQAAQAILGFLCFYKMLMERVGFYPLNIDPKFGSESLAYCISRLSNLLGPDLPTELI